MAIPNCTANTTVITTIGTTPQERGLTTDEFKAKFDEAATNIKEDLNTNIIPAVNAHLAEAKQYTDQEVGVVSQALNTHLAETVSKVVLVTEPYDQTTTTTVNLGFKPKWISVKAIIMGSKYLSDGVCTELSFQYCLTYYVYTGTYSIQGGAFVDLGYGTGQEILGIISAINDTGIEISWTVNGTIPDIGTGQRRLLISAIAHGEE